VLRVLSQTGIAFMSDDEGGPGGSPARRRVVFPEECSCEVDGSSFINPRSLEPHLTMASIDREPANADWAKRGFSCGLWIDKPGGLHASDRRTSPRAGGQDGVRDRSFREWSSVADHRRYQ
jgi:hypothetical protein